MPRHNKACRETDTKCYDPRTYNRSYLEITIDHRILLVQYDTIGKGINGNIENGIRPAARQVTEGLCRYKPREWSMAEIYYSYYYMSKKSKQSIVLTAKLQKHTEYMSTCAYITQNKGFM